MTARIFLYALSALFLPSVAWAHTCGPQTLEVKKGSTVDYGLTGNAKVGYQIVDKGDPLVAKIEPLKKNDSLDVWFRVAGTGNGVTNFTISWIGPHRQGRCEVKVTVAE